MSRIDSNRFAQIRSQTSQILPTTKAGGRESGRVLRLAAPKPDDRPVEGGPKGLRVRGKNRNYYLVKHYRGQRVRHSLGRNLEEARFQAQRILRDMELGVYSPGRFQQERIGVGLFLEEALNALRDRSQLSVKSVASYRGRVAHFLRYLGERHPRIRRLAEVDPGIALGFLEWRRQQLVNRSGKGTPRNVPAIQTVKDDIRRLRRLFEIAVDRGQMTSNPFANVKVPEKASDKKGPPRWLSAPEVKRLLAAAQQYDRTPDGPGAKSTFRGMFHDILHFYILTGLRKEELIYLTWDRVDLEWETYGRIHIKPTDTPVELLVHPTFAQAAKLDLHVQTLKKGRPLFANIAQLRVMVPLNYANQEQEPLLALSPDAWDSANRVLRVQTRVRWKQKASQGSVPLTIESRSILVRQQAVNRLDSPFVFSHPKDRGPLRSDPWLIFKQVLDIAGLPKNIRLHDLRHTFAFGLRSLRTPLETIKGLMRHADMEDTQIYAPYADEEGADAIQKLSGHF